MGTIRLLRLSVLVLLFLHLSRFAFTQQMHTLAVSINQPPLLTANAGNDITNADNLDVVLGAAQVANGGTGPYSYLWTPSTNLSSPSVANPTLDLIEAETSYAVLVTDAKGCTAIDEVAVLITIVSVEKSNKLFFVYPNPASHQLVVESTTSGGNLFLYDLRGTIVAREKNIVSKHTLDVSKLKPGIYVLKIQLGGTVMVAKISIH
jgi:hypothetical protein